MLSIEDRPAHMPKINTGQSPWADFLPWNWMGMRELAFPANRVITRATYDEFYTEPRYHPILDLYLKLGLALKHHGFETELRFPLNIDPVKKPLKKQILTRTLIRAGGQLSDRYVVIENIKFDPTHTIRVRPITNYQVKGSSLYLPERGSDPRHITFSLRDGENLVVHSVDLDGKKHNNADLAQRMLNYWLS